IPSFISEISTEMKNAAIDALENEKFIFGESVFKFEEEFAKYIGTKHAISVNSGSSALYLSLLSKNIGKGSTVITSTNSFVASANTILMAGAQPVLADIHNDDGNLNINNLDKNVNAVMPVHIYGNPCDFDSIKQFTEEKDIPVIEDACQAHGAMYKGKKVGSLGTIGCFSFYPTKNMTVSGDGGMITTDDDELAKILVSLRDNGRGENDRSVHERVGFTMRLNTINAAIGRVQLKNLDKFNSRRKQIAKMYKDNLENACFLKENPDGESVFHQILIRNKKRDELKEFLFKNNVGTAIHYPIPIHKQPIYQHLNLSLPISEKFSQEVLSLPSYPQLSDNEVMVICEKINEFLNNK
ncbi:DegT/DnrJ/EryC1/StrS aminotransferase family protein, partial [Nitrosopumilus sp.]|nr:DegT/DnrJ/EryC1/StrS aminotransferase family protein [Nitrosopumilus sp.]